MAQKEQKAVLQDFHAYAFNTLVATCIAEEGLDIPSVDLIVCLDTSSSPTRAMQRSGRTGRHRAGRVVYVLSAGKEEEKHKEGLRVRARACCAFGFTLRSPICKGSALRVQSYCTTQMPRHDSISQVVTRCDHCR
jgi:ERCC4-related helicase